MTENKKILFITDAYPRATAPDAGVFVYNLVQEMVQIGNSVTVIAFENGVMSFIKKKSHYGSEIAKIERFKLFTASSIKIGRFNTYSITEFQKKQAVKKVIKKYGNNFDVIYCHFLTSLMFSIKYIETLNIPIFVAVGENKGMDTLFDRHSMAFMSYAISKVTGFIAVSNVVAERLHNVFNIPKSSIKIIPNGVNRSRFYQKDRRECRKLLNISHNNFILIFVGRFIESKGPDRVIKAIMDYPEIKLIFVGEGNLNLQHSSIIFKGKVPNHDLPIFYNSANAFILPTLHEGSNNSILEAMACGLPIISSNIPEIREQCNDSFSYLVDPLNIDELHNAIISLFKNETTRDKMSLEALEHSKIFDLNNRAIKILKAIDEFNQQK